MFGNVFQSAPAQLSGRYMLGGASQALESAFQSAPAQLSGRYTGITMRPQPGSSFNPRPLN